jgi:acetyltransferase
MTSARPSPRPACRSSPPPRPWRAAPPTSPPSAATAPRRPSSRLGRAHLRARPRRRPRPLRRRPRRGPAAPAGGRGARRPDGLWAGEPAGLRRRNPRPCGRRRRRHGLPVVLKARALLRHKSEVGGVASTCATAPPSPPPPRPWRRRFPAAPPARVLHGFLVQRQAPRGMMELRLRMDDDAMFGPWIGFGQGGTAADLAQDEAFDLPPLNLPLAHGLIARTRLSRLLPGFRDRPPVNEPAIADALVRVSQLLVDFPEIATLVVNPLFADARGRAGGRRRADAAARGRDGAARHPALSRRARGQAFTARMAASTRSAPSAPRTPPPRASTSAASRRRTSASASSRPCASCRRPCSPASPRSTTTARWPSSPRMGHIFGTARIIRDGAGGGAEFAVVVGPSVEGDRPREPPDGARHRLGAGRGHHRAAGPHPRRQQADAGFRAGLGFTLSRSPEDTEIMEARQRLA